MLGFIICLIGLFCYLILFVIVSECHSHVYSGRYMVRSLIVGLTWPLAIACWAYMLLFPEN